MENESAKTIAALVNKMAAAAGELNTALHNHEFANTEEHMQYCATVLRPLMDTVRQYADALEGQVADSFWPLPTYQEMLFIK